MDFVTYLEHLSQDYDLGFDFFVFGRFTEISKILCLFLLFVFGLKTLYFPWFSRSLIQFFCDLREKSVKLEKEVYTEKVLDGDVGLSKDVLLNDILEESTEISNCYYSGSDSKINRVFDGENVVDNYNDHVKEYTEEDSESDPLYGMDGHHDHDHDELQTEDDSESDVSALRKLIKTERRRANAARAELVKERAASATAAQEAMAMILRLQKEKSTIEMEFAQYRRFAEEKHIHDQEVIQSLQWIVWRNISEMSLLQEELNPIFKSDERDHLEKEDEEALLSGYSEDVLEN